MGAIRRAWYEFKWMFEELFVLLKHPSRKASKQDAYRHWCKIWDELVFHPWYALKRGVRNFWIWKGIIWNTDVFDHDYLLRIMDKQLEEMQRFFEGPNTMSASAKRDAKRIKWTRRLLEMHRDETYAVKNYLEMQEKHGVKNDLESEVCQVDSYGIPVLYSLIDKRTEEQNEEYRVGMYKAAAMDEKVWKLFIKNLGHMRGWWD
jgi:hypothetical protein